jgi:uncharacterized protein YqiB (DUF1249 family)
VHREDLLIDNSGNRETVEAVGERLPQLDVITTFAYTHQLTIVDPAQPHKTLTFIIESIDSVDGSTLVISAEDEKVFWVFDLVCEQQANRLERLLSSVDVVTKEQIVRLGREAAVLEEA